MKGLDWIFRGEVTLNMGMKCAVGAAGVCGWVAIGYIMEECMAYILKAKPLFSPVLEAMMKRGGWPTVVGIIILLMIVLGVLAILIGSIALNEWAKNQYAYEHNYLPLKDRITKIEFGEVTYEFVDVREEKYTVVTVQELGVRLWNNYLSLNNHLSFFYAVTLDNGTNFTVCKESRLGDSIPLDIPKVGDQWRRLYGKRIATWSDYTVGEKEEAFLFERVP